MEGANNSAVTIKAVSTFNGEITATKSINVTYKETVEELTSISIVGDDVVGVVGAQYSIAYNPVNTSKVGVTWSIIDGSSSCSIDANGYFSITGSGIATIQAVSIYDDTIVATKSVEYTYTQPITTLAIPIVTDIKIDDIENADMEMYIERVTSGSGKYGGGIGSGGYGQSTGFGYTWWLAGAGSASITYGSKQVDAKSPSDRMVYIVRVGKNGASIKVGNDTPIEYMYGESPNFAASQYPIAIGSKNNGSSEDLETKTVLSCGYIKIWESGILTHSFIAYQDDSGIGFKDTITQKIYYGSSSDEKLSYKAS